MADVVISYTLEQAIADGELVAIFLDKWEKISGGKPIVATSHLFAEVSQAGLLEIWNEYVLWRKEIMPTLSEEDWMFVTSMNGKSVWVIEDAQAFTLLYPEDY